MKFLWCTTFILWIGMLHFLGLHCIDHGFLGFALFIFKFTCFHSEWTFWASLNYVRNLEFMLVCSQSKLENYADFHSMRIMIMKEFHFDLLIVPIFTDWTAFLFLSFLFFIFFKAALFLWWTTKCQDFFLPTSLKSCLFPYL